MSRSTQVVNISGMSDLANNEDRISNLPDRLMSHILSCLPTKDAVRTSVLSKAWEYKWTSISKIDIDGCVDEAAFANFVERLLLHALGIKSVHLDCVVEKDSVRLTSWISALLQRNIETFDFICECESGFVIPRGSLLNSNSSLRILRLVSSCFKVPAKICFANLRSLNLGFVKILNDNPISNHLIFTFPVLETLKLYYCQWLKVKFVEINAPKLITFSYDAPIIGNDGDYLIKIIGDKLKEINTGYLEANTILTGSLVVKRVRDSNYGVGHVPSCLIGCAETVHFEGCLGGPPQYHHRVKFVLQVNETQLRTVQVDVLDHLLMQSFSWPEVREPDSEG